MTEYTVALRNMVSGPAKAALSDAEKLRSGLVALEASGARARRGSSAGAFGRSNFAALGQAAQRDEQRAAAAQMRREALTARAADREATAQARLNAQALRSANQIETAKRNAAFRRLMAQQRDEQRLIELNIRADRRRAAEHERNQARMQAATLRRLRAEQAAADRRHATSVNRFGAGGRAIGGGLQAGIGLAGGVLGAGVGLAAAGGAYVGKQAVDTAQLVENARMRFKAQLGSTEAANAEIKDSARIAEKTVFDFDQVLEGLGQLSVNFKDAARRRYIFAAISDFATATGKGNEGLERGIRAISQIAGKGKLQQEELTGQLGELGLSATEVYKQLAVMLNIQGKTEQEQREKVLKAITGGKVDSNTAIQAITNVMRDNKEAGSTAAGAAGTLTSLMSNITKGFQTLFAVSDIEGWPAMVELKALLKDISGLFSVDSDVGRDFMGVLKDITAAEVVPFLRSLREDIKQLPALFSGSAREATLFLKGLFALADAAATLARILTYPIVKLIELLGLAREWDQRMGAEDIGSASSWKNAGVAAVKGFAQGIYDFHAEPIKAIRDMITGVRTTTEGDLQIKSPSRVMMRYGANTVEGFAIGMRGKIPVVDRTAEAMSGAAMVSGSGSRSGSGGAAVSITINMPVQTAGSAAELASEAGPLIGAEIERQMNRYYARQLAQGGA